MTAGIGGIGKKCWGWVRHVLFYLLFADTKTPGNLLLRNLLKALAMKAKHTAVVDKFKAILPMHLLLEWTNMISEWEQDKTKPNPYTHTEKGDLRYFITFELSC